MWPLDLPAHKVLKLPQDTKPAWAVFDPHWYRLSYPDVADHIAADQPAALLRYHLESGQRQGHSPNRFFNEAWHRHMYPRIAAGIEGGEFASAFDAYCRRGCLDRSPHWLFDELGYRDRYPDLTPEVLSASGLANSYDHYLQFGGAEDRIGHRLFDPTVYLANFAADDIPVIRQQGVFNHYLRRTEAGEPELPASHYFDSDWYRQRYPDVANAIRLGLWKSALQHYLCNDTPANFDPLDSFSEAHYLALDPGLQAAITSRHFRNGYLHFLGFGARELRSPTASIDLSWYAAQPRVRCDLDQGLAPGPFAHWLTIGRRDGLPSAAPDADRITEAQARALSHHAAIALLPIAGRFGYTFECAGDPLVSVVMPVRDSFATTMATIASLRGNSAGSIELIIVDRGSGDETRAIGDYVRGARLLRFETDIGWSQAANAGSQFATATAVLFLTTEVRLGPTAIERACARLAGDSAIGAVGGMVIQPNGLIEQAGGILWNDGGTHDYQRGRPPLSPEANFVRSVDFCSSTFLLVRAVLLARLDGFDPECAASGHEGVDLCTRIIQAGAQVVYDPSVVLFHDDHDRRPVSADAHFLRKHATYLSQRAAPGGPVQVFARHSGPLHPRVLFIDDTVPLRRIGSGFVRSNDVVKAMAELGYQVTVFPVNGCVHDPARVFGDMPDTAEVMHDHAIDRFKALLADRIGYYDYVWIVRTHNLDQVRPGLAQVTQDGAVRPLIILDTEAIAPLREAEQARLRAVPHDLETATTAAFVNADICDAVVAVSQEEAKILRARDIGPVAIVGHGIEPDPTSRPHAQRAGMLFVGAIHTPDSPNLDSLIWFTDAVLPLIEHQLGWETRLTIAGYTAPNIDLGRFAHHPRITMRGTVTDLRSLYNSHRVFVAPTRYAAGTPYKVFEAASRGLPVVATALLRRQLGWVDAEEMLSAGTDDPEAFAAAVVALYRQEELWRGIRAGALRRIERDNRPADFANAVALVLAAARTPG
ncbi:glycosyltransferase [Rhodopila sp.]|uniref:glycosyltransferase n=1 Tax=Rhodopila sp. TaxID=2480087 RepID=UPI003D0E3EBB